MIKYLQKMKNDTAPVIKYVFSKRKLIEMVTENDMHDIRNFKMYSTDKIRR